MPKTQASNSTGSSGLGITRKLKKNHLITPYDLPRNQDLINLITNNKENDIHDIEFLCDIYIFKDMFPPIDFKELCNSAIKYNQPFYLSLILNSFGRGWSPRKNKNNFKATPLITATYSEKFYPFAMLLYLSDLSELHINFKIENENIFDRINALNKSFYVFLLVMKDKNLINKINDEKHKNISPLKTKINLIVKKSLLHDAYTSIESEFQNINQTLDNLRTIKNNKYITEYSEVMALKLSIKTVIDKKIEEDLKDLSHAFLKICNLSIQDIENIKTTNISSYPIHNPPLSHTSQSNFQTEHPINQNPKNHFRGSYPQPYASQGTPQASANPPTPQNLPHTLTAYQAPQSSHQVSHSTNRCDLPVTPTILTTELNRSTGNS